MNNILKLSEIIYNAYISYNNNYYNTININNIIISYFQNDYIKNNIIKKILNNQNNDILEIILTRQNRNININFNNEQKEIKPEINYLINN